MIPAAGDSVAATCTIPAGGGFFQVSVDGVVMIEINSPGVVQPISIPLTPGSHSIDYIMSTGVTFNYTEPGIRTGGAGNTPTVVPVVTNMASLGKATHTFR
ncbi:MAG: hypothetical protein HQM07_09080 [Zetaproteobacteria bacterium]|nr:hypothetical protein [Zetaproteobacteria bacterium]